MPHSSFRRRSNRKWPIARRAEQIDAHAPCKSLTSFSGRHVAPASRDIGTRCGRIHAPKSRGSAPFLTIYLPFSFPPVLSQSLSFSVPESKKLIKRSCISFDQQSFGVTAWCCRTVCLFIMRLKFVYFLVINLILFFLLLLLSGFHSWLLVFLSRQSLSHVPPLCYLIIYPLIS